MQVVHYDLTIDVGPFLVGLELSSLSPEFFPGLVFTEFHSLAFDTLGILGVALHLILDLDLGCLFLHVNGPFVYPYDHLKTCL